MTAIDFDDLLNRTWWTFDPAARGFDRAYHWMNLLEGAVWLVLAALVLARYLRHRRSPIELAYAAAFATFGLSDFREAFVLETWLIAAKGANLLALIVLRWWVITRYYPGSRVY